MEPIVWNDTSSAGYNRKDAIHNAEELGNKIMQLEKELYAPEQSELRVLSGHEGTEGVSVETAAGVISPVGGAKGKASAQADFKRISEVEQRFRKSKIDFLLRHIMEYQLLFRRLAEVSKGDAFLFLDDLYQIPREDQSKVIDYFHRIAKGNGLWLKVGTIRHRTSWYVHGNPPCGMKIDDDADQIDLDLTLEKYGLAKAFLVKPRRQSARRGRRPGSPPWRQCAGGSRMTAVSRPLDVAIAGFGTVGRAVARLLCERRHPSLRLVAIGTRRPDAARRDAPWILPDVSWTSSLDALLEPGTDVVVELIGGIEPARTWIAAALRAGRSVVTANKQVVAEHGPELFSLARSCGSPLRFEAAVAGAVPVIRGLQDGLAGDRVTRVRGVVNGTCNFVLGRMTGAGESLMEAVREAQARGFAEADPAANLDGFDARAKLSILASNGFGRHLPPRGIPAGTIRGIDAGDIAAAASVGRVIRQVVWAGRSGHGADGLTAGRQRGAGAVRLSGRARGPKTWCWCRASAAARRCSRARARAETRRPWPSCPTCWRSPASPACLCRGLRSLPAAPPPTPRSRATCACRGRAPRPAPPAAPARRRGDRTRPGVRAAGPRGGAVGGPGAPVPPGRPGPRTQTARARRRHGRGRDQPAAVRRVNPADIRLAA